MVTIDITKDLRYRQGFEERRALAKGEAHTKYMKEVAEKLFMNGQPITVVHSVTDLLLGQLEEISQKVVASKG